MNRATRGLPAFALVALAAGANAAGRGVGGTKLDPTYGPAVAAGPGLGWAPMAQMLVALGIVAALLKWVLPRFAGKLGNRLAASAEGGIRIEESATFAGGALYVVCARGKTLLLSVSGQNVASLADLTPTIAAPQDPFEAALADAERRAAQPGPAPDDSGAERGEAPARSPQAQLAKIAALAGAGSEVGRGGDV